MAQVPQAWTQLVEHHRRAQVAHDQMRDRDLPQAARDEATVHHARALDGMFAALDRLSEQRLLHRIDAALKRGLV